MEIIKDVPMSPQDSIMLDMHSFYNVINIISGELQILEMLSGQDQCMQDCVGLCFKIKDGLTDSDKIVEYAQNIDEHLDFILKRVQELLSSHPHLQNEDDARESVENINSVLNILKVRAQEILARYKAPNKWEKHDLSQLKQNFLDVFEAIARNSKGRYGFVYNIAAWTPKDYFVAFQMESVDGDHIFMPPVFQDVMRDLIANARKYTDPGGKVLAGLLDDGQNLRFSVEDTGMGIPEEEVQRVVDFGFRASNTVERRTMGGGFGLTKAYCVTKQFNGRFWISSKEGQGTRVDIIMPRQA